LDSTLSLPGSHSGRTSAERDPRCPTEDSGRRAFRDVAARRLPLVVGDKSRDCTRRRIAILARPQHPGEHRESAASEEAAQKLGTTVAYFPILEMSEIDKAFAMMRQERCDAVVVFPDHYMTVNRDRISRLSLDAKLPAISGWPGFAESGFLFNFGPNLRDLYRGLARYVNRILRGAKPQDLPVEPPRTVELVVNLRTAKALGIDLPQSIMLRADRVIE
jgi:ABC-type uncharacterized transport system substrate-binding protein